MGLAASQARLLMLTARKSDLEFQLQMVNQRRMILAQLMSNLIGQQLNMGMEPDQENMRATEAATAQIQHLDKMLELESRRLDTQHQAVQTEMEAVQKVISKNIESSFKLMG